MFLEGLGPVEIDLKLRVLSLFLLRGQKNSFKDFLDPPAVVKDGDAKEGQQSEKEMAAAGDCAERGSASDNKWGCRSEIAESRVCSWGER